MKIKNYKKHIIALVLVSSFTFGQKDDKKVQDPTVTITPRKSIGDYHTEEQLRAKNKGDLITLYQERFDLMVNLLPQIGFTFRPNQDLKALGIPLNNDTKENTEAYNKGKEDYIKIGKEFQTNMLSYSDSSNIIKAIVFFEEILKNMQASLSQ
jgi:hypothetical protein